MLQGCVWVAAAVYVGFNLAAWVTVVMMGVFAWVRGYAAGLRSFT